MYSNSQSSDFQCKYLCQLITLPLRCKRIIFYVCKIASSVQSLNHPLYLFFRKQNYIFMTNARTYKSSFKCLKKEILLKFKMPL